MHKFMSTCTYLNSDLWHQQERVHAHRGVECHMDSEKASAMQLQLRQNSLELQEYLSGLESWEEEIKSRDESLTRNKPILKEVRRQLRFVRCMHGEWMLYMRYYLLSRHACPS